MSKRLLLRTRALLGTAFLSSLAAVDLPAQMVEAGIARDKKLGTPLECLHVALLDSTGRAVAHTVTDSTGQFQLEAPSPGTHRVEFSIFWWEPLAGPVDTLVEGSFKQRVYPLDFANRIVPDSSYERTYRDHLNRERLNKYKRMEAYLRTLESRSTWRSREFITRELALPYPSELRAGRVEGTVLARFIVDSTGRARPDSWRTLLATHPAFEKAMKATLRPSRWKPARIAGRPVCELTMDYARFFLDFDVAHIAVETR